MASVEGFTAKGTSVIAVRKQGQATATVHAVDSGNAVPAQQPAPSPPAALLNGPTANRSCVWFVYPSALVLLALLCLSWTLWMMLLTISPTATVNRLMGTANLDGGAFWRLSESSQGVVIVGSAGHGAVVLGYVVVCWQIMKATRSSLKWRFVPTKAARDRSASKISGFLIASQTQAPSDSRLWSSNLKRRASELAIGMLDTQSQTRRRINSLIKVADVVLQCVLLMQLMQSGVPVALIGVFAMIVALNAATASLVFVLPHDNVGRAQLLVDTAFDVLVALALPMIVLSYALSSFTFDKELMVINTQVFPPGSFERIAAVVADPVEVETVRRTLDTLRINSVTKIFTRVGTSAMLCRRMFGLVDLLRARGAGVTEFPNVYPKKNFVLASLFLSVSIAVVVYTSASVQTSTAACKMHPECVQIARRWIIGLDENDPTRCPCLAMIDRNTAVGTAEEWEKPFDRTEKFAQLAASGDLQTIQLVNRALPTFPEELRRCKGHKHVSLYYTESVVMPDWFAEFTKLEFLHVEGKSPFKSFQQLPHGLFDNMDELAFAYFGLQGLHSLPPLDGLTNLKTLVVAALLFLTELPSFDKLRNLESLQLILVPRVEVLPDLTQLRDLQSFTVLDRGIFCCNGFLGPDKCDLNRTLCREGIFGTSPVTQCLPPSRVATPATRAYFDKFPFTVCYGEAVRDGEIKFLPTVQEMVECNGTLYRACEAPGMPPGTPAMCYNTRWMAIACDASPFPIEMRRRQIAQARGAPCDPKYEAWLGCA